MNRSDTGPIIDRLPFSIDGAHDPATTELTTSAAANVRESASAWLPWGCEGESAATDATASRTD